MVSGRFYDFYIVIGREKPHVIPQFLLFEKTVFIDQCSGYLCAGHPSLAKDFHVHVLSLYHPAGTFEIFPLYLRMPLIFTDF